MQARTQEILDYLDQQRVQLRAAFNSVPLARQAQPQAPDRWSAVGVIEHLAKTETNLAARLAARIEDARAQGLGAETETSPLLATWGILGRVLDRTEKVTASQAVQPAGLDAEDAWDALEQAGEGVRMVLRASDGLALETTQIPFSRFGEVSIYFMFAFVGAHEARHALQIREIAISKVHAVIF